MCSCGLPGVEYPKLDQIAVPGGFGGAMENWGGITYFESTDGAATWSVRRVTKSSWDPSQYGVPSGSGIRPFIGDYDGIVSLPTAVGMR